MSIKIEINDDNLKKLKSFKPIFEYILETEFEFNEYINSVISIGLDKMFNDAVPAGQARKALKVAFETNDEFMCDLILEIYQKGDEISEDEKIAMKVKMARYIH